MMKCRYFLIAGLMVLAVGCHRKNAESPPGSNDTNDENTLEELPAELTYQLKAMGYPVPKKIVRRKNPKRNPYENADIAHFMDGIDATFVFLDEQRDIQLIHNDARANIEFSPCSTFKIANTLIALETGVMVAPETEIKWDRKKYPQQPVWKELNKIYGINWAQDHTLKSAFKNSCVWCYMEIAEGIGTERMKTWVNRFEYGNRDISNGKWPFWLESSLKISAVAQVRFLKRFANNELELSPRTNAMARDVFKKAHNGDAVLYAKTGSGDNIGWFVGFVAKGDNRYVFAFNMPRDVPDFPTRRESIPMKVLQELGIWL